MRARQPVFHLRTQSARSSPRSLGRAAVLDGGEEEAVGRGAGRGPAAVLGSEDPWDLLRAEAPAADLDEAPHHVPNLSPGVGEGGYWETGGIQGVVYRAGAKPMGEEGYHPVKEPRSPNCNSHLWPHRDASKQLRSQPSCPDWTHERTPAVKSTRTRGVPGTTAWPPDAMADAGGVP